MDRDITQYVSLLKSFLAGEISAEEFQAKYIDMFKAENRELDPSLFAILDAVFGDVDSLVFKSLSTTNDLGRGARGST